MLLKAVKIIQNRAHLIKMVLSFHEISLGHIRTFLTCLVLMLTYADDTTYLGLC